MNRRLRVKCQNCNTIITTDSVCKCGLVAVKYTDEVYSNDNIIVVYTDNDDNYELVQTFEDDYKIVSYNLEHKLKALAANVIIDEDDLIKEIGEYL